MDLDGKKIEKIGNNDCGDDSEFEFGKHKHAISHTDD
jgi:hypothetical protein